MKSSVAILFCVACSASPAVSVEAGAGDASDDAADASASIRVTGAVVDTQNAPWAAAKIQVCSETLCTLGDANASGAFDVQVPAGNLYHVIARPSPSDAREGSAGLFVLQTMLTSDTALAAPIPIPVTGAHLTQGDAGNISGEVASDLTLTANANDVGFDGDVFFSGVAIPQNQWAAFSIEGKTILAMWALNPWGTRTNSGKSIGVSITNHFGLNAGDAVSVYAVNETTAALDPPTQASVSPDAATIDGATIDRLTWIVVALLLLAPCVATFGSSTTSSRRRRKTKCARRRFSTFAKSAGRPNPTHKTRKTSRSPSTRSRAPRKSYFSRFIREELHERAKAKKKKRAPAGKSAKRACRADARMTLRGGWSVVSLVPRRDAGRPRRLGA